MHGARIVLLAAVTAIASCSSPGGARSRGQTPSADRRIRVQGRVVPDDLGLREEELEAAWAGDGRLQAGAEVVFAGAVHEVTAGAAADGSYDVRLPPGRYHVFVRGERVASGGGEPATEPPYLRPAPGPRPLLGLEVDLERDTIGLDVPAIELARVSGRVVDPAGKPVVGALVREHEPGMVVVAGGDAAVTDADGRYQLRLLPWRATLEVTHPDFARVMLTDIELAPGSALERDVALRAGCTITGRVFADDGRPAGPGTIVRKGVKENGERARRQRFFRAGAIAADGSFRWSTADAGEVILAAWPESMDMSPPRSFACRDGARFDGVAFRVAASTPDTTGVVLRPDGTPAAATRVLARPAGWGGMRQYAVTGADGRFAMVGLARGNYEVTVVTARDGTAVRDITLPQRDVRLVLSGTRRLEGSTPALAEGAFLLRTEFGKPPMEILVPVHGGRFAIDGLPANFSGFRWIWRDSRGWVDLDSAGARPLSLPILGPLRAKRVTGVVRFRGQPVRGAVIAVERRPGALFAWRSLAADDSGRYALDTFAGAELQVRAPLDGKTVSDSPGEGAAELWGHASVDPGPAAEHRLDIDLDVFYDD